MHVKIQAYKLNQFSELEHHYRKKKDRENIVVLPIIVLCVFMVCLIAAEACRLNRVPQQSCGCTSSSCSRGRA